MRALLRRPSHVAPPCHAIGNLRVDTLAALVHVDEVALKLTATEYRLLSALAEAEGGTRTHAQLMDAAFGPFSAASRNGLDVALHRLRARLQAQGATAAIVNHRGVGHALVPVATP